MPRSERSDVVRHRAAILGAAGRVFSEQGVHASLDLVVEAAGVGRGTLYRHFCDRTALLIALFDAEMKDMMAVVDAAPARLQLSMMLQHMARSARAPVLADAWRAIPAGHPEMQASRDRLKRFFDRVRRAGITTGELDARWTLDAVVIMARMVANASRGEEDRDTAEALGVKIVLEGVRPSHARRNKEISPPAQTRLQDG